MLNPDEDQQEVVAALNEEVIEHDRDSFELALNIIAHNIGSSKEKFQNHDLYEDLWEDDTLANAITTWYLKWKDEEDDDVKNAHAFVGHVRVSIRNRAHNYSSDLQTAVDYLVGDGVNRIWGEWCFALARLSHRE